jgi:hypothetical protein
MHAGKSGQRARTIARPSAEIDARLDGIRTRLQQLRERDWDTVKSQAASTGQRLAAAQRYAAEAQAAAVQVLAASAEAFRRAAEAHDRVAGVHERAAGAGIGDMGQHERQAAPHRAAAAADRQRAECAQSVLSGPERAGPPAPVSDEPGDGVTR